MVFQNFYTIADDNAEEGLEAEPVKVRVLINSVIQVERSKNLQTGEGE